MGYDDVFGGCSIFVVLGNGLICLFGGNFVGSRTWLCWEKVSLRKKWMSWEVEVG